MKNIKAKFIAVLCIAVSCMCLLVGCQKEPEYKPREHGIIVYDGIGNEYGMQFGRENNIEYEYSTGVMYHFSYKGFFKDKKDEYVSHDMRSISGSDVGTHTMFIYYGGDVTTVNVIIKEKPRLTPEVSFDPNGAIEYTENERYVYSYDGEEHYPIIKLSYNGEELNIGEKIAKAISSPSSLDPKLYLIAVGTYRVGYMIGDSDFVNAEDRGIYESMIYQITVEIIAAE